MTTKAQQRERQEAIEHLREFIKPGDTVYTTLKHVSRSGMLRIIDVHVIEDNQPRWIAYTVAKAIDAPFNQRASDGIKMTGCGMDMGFALVYDLSYNLFRDGFDCTGENCHSNDHSNGDRDRTPHRHSDPGYALRHRWL